MATTKATELSQLSSALQVDESTGEIIFTGSLSVDSNTLFIDSDANRVGIGTLTPGSALDVAGNVSVSGTVDGRDVAADGSKLDTIESGAKDDQTISAGSGLSGGGTGDVTLNHADTSSQVSINNFGGTVVQDIGVDGYGHITNIGSADLDSRYYTESEINENLAGLRGWVPAYDNGDITSVRWNFDEDAVELQDNDTQIGMAYQAVRMKAGETKRFTVMVRGNTARNSGLYLRIYQHDGDMPDGKTHVSHNATYAFVEEDDRGDTGWVENVAVSTSWTTYEREYTAPVDGYVSLVVLNWSGYDTNSLYVKTPDIQTRKSHDSDRLDGLNSTQFLRSDTSDTLNGDLSVSGSIDVNSATVINQAQTLSTTAFSQIASFGSSGASSAKVLITATRGSDKQISELLVIHNGIDAFATEYGVVTTSAPLFNVDVDISGSDVRVLAEGTTSTTTEYTTFLTLIGV